MTRSLWRRSRRSRGDYSGLEIAVARASRPHRVPSHPCSGVDLGAQDSFGKKRRLDRKSRREPQGARLPLRPPGPLRTSDARQTDEVVAKKVAAALKAVSRPCSARRDQGEKTLANVTRSCAVSSPRSCRYSGLSDIEFLVAYEPRWPSALAWLACPWTPRSPSPHQEPRAGRHPRPLRRFRRSHERRQLHRLPEVDGVLVAAPRPSRQVRAMLTAMSKV